MHEPINIIDLFAGPGGLGEGFASLKSSGTTPFQIRISVEKEESAHKTLTLRALFRKLKKTGKLDTYFDYVEGRISKQDLIKEHPNEWSAALEETMGRPTALGEDNDVIHARLKQLKKLHRNEPWIVIGGPPCQAYSLAGRVRNSGIASYKAKDDHRHFLYKEYLKVLSIIEPDVFVMENVKGILSSKIDGENIFPKILEDLKNPGIATGQKKNGRKYHIFSFVESPDAYKNGQPIYEDLKDFVIRCEDHGIPQTRHRVILLGVDTKKSRAPNPLPKLDKIDLQRVIGGLPDIRSKLSRGADHPDNWKEAIADITRLAIKETKKNPDKKHLADFMRQKLITIKTNLPTTGKRYKGNPISLKCPPSLKNWLLDSRPKYVLNHESRGHISGDLGRYFFCSSWAAFESLSANRSSIPKAMDFPSCLTPNHANWKTGKFTDRFRVQPNDRPATTITSHISKDGHYFIHPDPRQCRSLTVREAARIQTFPDNYFFEGNKTQQYVQVGNAVPPLLAHKLAEIVIKIIYQEETT